MSSFKKQIPNLLTLFRFLITPIIFGLVIRGNNYLAMFLILLGATSDILDGVLARKFKACSSFGYIFEHIIDKIYLIPIVYIVFKYLDVRFAALVTLLEITTIVFSLKLGKKKEKDWPNIWGKISYGFLIGSSCAALIGANEPATQLFYFPIDSSCVVFLGTNKPAPWLAYFLLLGNMALAVTIAFRAASFVYFFKKGENETRNY